MSTKRARPRPASGAKSILFAAALATARPLCAGISYDLRFADGTHNALVTTPSLYTLEIWARVSGTNASITDEGFQSNNLTLMSAQFDGGAMTIGGLSSAAVTTTF